MRILPFILALASTAMAESTRTNAPPAHVEKPTAPPAPSAKAPTPDAARKAFVIPVKGPIDNTRHYILKRGIEEAKAAGAGAIVLDMNTLGGALFITEEMTKLLIEQKVPTYTFVEKDAISAGAIIAYATDHIYMNVGSRIGDAMPVMMSSSGGGYETLGDAEREKITSPTDAMVRVIAQRKGRDVELIRSMVRRELEYKIGDTVIDRAGEILTLTNVEAERKYGDPPKPLLSLGTVDSVEKMLEMAGKKDWQIQRMTEAPAESLANFISTISPILIAIASLLYYLELNSPGFGWAGITAIALFAVFFLGQHAAGLAGNEEFGLFALGLLLIVLEIYVIPGFGLAGITGLALVVGSLFAAMVKYYPETSGPLLPESDWSMWDRLYGAKLAMRRLSLGILGAGAGIALLGRYIPETRFGRRLALNTTIGTSVVSPAEETALLLNLTGVAMTDLRPSGRIQIGERVVDVISSGGYIPKGSSVRIVQAKGSRVVVETDTPVEGGAT
jgi:membrane-bound serine protease (ClpP class)